MPSSVCSFARSVSLTLSFSLPFSISLSLAYSLSFSLIHIYIHSSEPGATVAVCTHHQLSCNQPASQPASHPASQPSSHPASQPASRPNPSESTALQFPNPLPRFSTPTSADSPGDKTRTAPRATPTHPACRSCRSALFSSVLSFSRFFPFSMSSSPFSPALLLFLLAVSAS